MDHLGPFTQSASNIRYILTIVDGFSKFTYLKAVPDSSTKHVIIILEELFTILGNPIWLVTDAGTAFASTAFKSFTARKGIKLFVCAVGLTRANEQAERINKVILDAPATMSTNTRDNWDTVLSKVQEGINSTKHRITNYTPAEFQFGFKLKTDSDIHDTTDEQTVDVTKIRKDVADKLEANRLCQDSEFNKRRKLPTLYQVVDLVLIKVNSLPATNDKTAS